MRGIILFSAILAMMIWHSTLPQSISIPSGLQLVECPPDGIPEQETCGDDINGGCDMEPGTEYFEPIECGTTICGTGWADGGLRDTDWYTLTLIDRVMLVARGEAEFPFELAIIVPGNPDPCIRLTIRAIDQAAEGEILIIRAPVGPGEVWVRANDSRLDGNPCGDDDDDYYLAVDYYRPCNDSITVEIHTDHFPYETSWELIERESGTVVASAGPLSDYATLHTWQVCVDRTRCYDWYIYDSFGDGLICYYGGCGYYMVYGFDGELLCYGGEFEYVDVCPDIGNCVPPVGACCIEFVCVDDMEEQLCLSQGGTWYESETCPEFQCPTEPCPDAVWHNGAPTAYNFYASQCDPVYPFQTASVDDFILPGVPGEGLIEVTGIIAWFSHWLADPLATPADYEGVIVTVYNDAGGEPDGHPIDGPDCAVAGNYVFHQYYEPGQFAYSEEFTDVWRLSIEISDLTLNSGIIYWLSIEPVMQFDPFGQSGNTPSNQQTGSRPLQWTNFQEWSPAGDFDISFCINGLLRQPCDYIPGDCDNDGSPIELGDVTAMIGMYRGSIMTPYECFCPPQGDNFAPTADPNGNCVSNELYDVVTEIGAYRGNMTVSSCSDCPGSDRLIPEGDKRPGAEDHLKNIKTGFPK